MGGNEGVITAPGTAVEVDREARLETLRSLRARCVADLGEASKTVKAIDKDIARAEKGGQTGYQAVAIAYKGEEVMDRITTIQAANEDLLAKGGTIFLKITGGDVRPMSYQGNQKRHFSGSGIRRITQVGVKGNAAPRCVNVVDLPDGSFQLSAGNEMDFDKHSEKSWE